MFKEILYKLPGDDHRIIKQCDKKTKTLFLTIGIFIPVIFALCFISSWITFSQVFNNRAISIFLSLFFSWMITNIYVLLLYTLTKNTLFRVDEPARFSLCIRLAFVVFISIVASKPIETMLYSPVLDADIETYKAETKKINHDRILFYYKAQTDEIKRININHTYQQQFIRKKEHDRLIVTSDMYRLVDSSGYYLQRIKFLNARHASCWLITILFTLIFMLPIYLKRKMNSAYYAIKGSYEKRKVIQHYSAFKKKYSAIFEKSHNKTVTYSEAYMDAPFNTIKKEDLRKFYSEKELLSELYNA